MHKAEFIGEMPLGDPIRLTFKIKVKRVKSVAPKRVDVNLIKFDDKWAAWGKGKGLATVEQFHELAKMEMAVMRIMEKVS